MIDLAILARTIRAHEEQTRVQGRNVIAIAGAIGHINSDLQVILRLAALSPRARDAAQELVDAEVIDPDTEGRLFLARMPVGIEVDLLRRALGLEKLPDVRAA